MADPLRKIVKREYYRTYSHPNNAKDSVIVTLECGCTKGYKGSQEPGERARCNNWHCPWAKTADPSAPSDHDDQR